MRKILALLIVSIVILGQASFVLASNVCDPCDSPSDCTAPASECTDKNADGIEEGYCYEPGKFTICSPTKADSIEDIVENVTNWVFQLAIIVAPVMIIIGAIMFMTAGGDPKKVQKGKQVIFWTLIGFLIVLFAQGIINLINYIIGR